jgi:ferritin
VEGVYSFAIKIRGDINMQKNLNELLQATFQMNSHADNCAYWLGFNNFKKIETIFHEKFAHKFPEWADKISDIMLKLNIHPIRKGLEDNDYDYTDILELFEDVETELEHYRELIYKIIDTATAQNVREIVGFLDDFLAELLDYKSQVNIWIKKAEQLIQNPIDFDKYFESFTFI